ncbi:DNA-3-methyladenine glycosylase family protein [Haloarcula salinisoli]|uniref:DNA-3-methyladenine glycosylase 2 family protein n=1 Tax=Haloarcula salinisoli TaxID=2487746 RepID=A0A8J7YJW5_9EURY|nr:DNA-3-methyladenine glycosylase 2 family protein [Halomicroarcula salinisoli]MBX0285351.1 DNA-3-methyladenine glycosylase 2 family protein [Halomicroarcula salinisoli]MBX0303171.1 DNA-3-methyladenine glycosylase 2 family protein [Halomicroarcula salinisoli]
MTDSPHEFLREDPDIGPLVDAHGELTLDPAEDLFRRLVVSICRQQVSMASAAATRDRLFEAVEMTPAGVLAADDTLLEEAGLSRQKTRYVNEVAAAFEEQGYSVEYFDGLADDAVRDELTAITGVGEWTANMQLLFSLGREDVFPVGDLGVRKGFTNVVGEGYSRSEMVEYAKRWAPYRSYATLYLWRAEEDIAESVAEVQTD